MNNKFIITFLCALSISGCSKKAEETTTVESTDIQEATADAVNQATVVSSLNEPNTTPSFEHKPHVILNSEINSVEASRRMVREAKVNFTAQDVVKTTLAVEKIALDAGGFIEQKNIDFIVVDTQRQRIADSKIRVFEKVTPLAFMVLRVPSEHAANVVNQLLPLMYFLNQQQYSAKRYELRLLEDKISQSQFVPSDTHNVQQSEIARLTRMEVQDRERYSTISLEINQPSLVRERIEIDVDAVANLNGDGFWTRAWNGAQYGWQFVLDFFVVLITIWPLYLIVVFGSIIYSGIKRLIKKFK